MSDATREHHRATSHSLSGPGAAGTVAVVGAGVAGSAVAYALRDADREVTVFEREREPGGRTATRCRDGCRYDCGANYATSADDRVSRLVRSLDEGDLVDIEPPVWTFDADGAVEPGDEDRADDHKWTFEDGISTLPRRLLERSRATVRTGTPVTALEPTGDRARWLLVTGGDTRFGPFDAVVLTPPGPRTARILEAGAVPDGRLAALASAAETVPFRTVHSFALHYPFPLDRPYYALVDTSREHAIGWVSREECKRGHVPDGETLLIVQPSPDWSVEHRETPADRAATAAADRVANLLEDGRLADPDWTDRRRWRRALPDAAVDEARTAEPVGVYVAGDWVRGEGRIHAALSSGLEVGTRLRAECE